MHQHIDRARRIPPSDTRRRTRPAGVKLIAFIQAFNALALGLQLLVSRVDPSVVVAGDPGFQGTVLAVAGLVVAVGLWQLYHWAWLATMLWAGLTLAIGLISLIDGRPVSHLVMVITIVQVFYLNLSDVQQAFGRTRAFHEPER